MDRDHGYVDPSLLQQFFNQKPSDITFLVVGKTGVGKSALVNSLIGEKVAEEGDEAIASLTSQVEKYQSSVQCQDTNTIHITVWDSPGYEDEEQEESYFSQMSRVQQQSDIDLLLFCISMRDTRWRKDDERALRAIDQTFGPLIWKRAMIALTQANTMQDSNGQATKQTYERKLRAWTDKIYTVLRGLGVQVDVPTIPTGSFAAASLPNTDDWFSDFWTQAICSMAANKRVGFMRLNQARIHFANKAFNSEAVESGATPSQSTYEQLMQHQQPPQQQVAQNGAGNEFPTVMLDAGRSEKVKNSLWESFKEFGHALVSIVSFSFVASAASCAIGFFRSLFG